MTNHHMLICNNLDHLGRWCRISMQVDNPPDHQQVCVAQCTDARPLYNVPPAGVSNFLDWHILGHSSGKSSLSPWSYIVELANGKYWTGRVARKVSAWWWQRNNKDDQIDPLGWLKLPDLFALTDSNFFSSRLPTLIKKKVTYLSVPSPISSMPATRSISRISYRSAAMYVIAVLKVK